MSFDRIPGQIGHLTLNLSGAILSSGGDLENDEITAASIFKLLTAVRTGDFGSEVEKISVNYADHSYTVSALNNKINIVKKAVADVYA